MAEDEHYYAERLEKCPPIKERIDKHDEMIMDLMENNQAVKDNPSLKKIMKGKIKKGLIDGSPIRKAKYMLDRANR